jgi:hypothetical protein
MHVLLYIAQALPWLVAGLPHLESQGPVTGFNALLQQPCHQHSKEHREQVLAGPDAELSNGQDGHTGQRQGLSRLINDINGT